MKKTVKAPLSALKMKLATNVVLGVLVCSVGALCLAPQNGAVTANGEKQELYRSAGEKAVGVSLMFNVYWGTDEVYEILDILKEQGGRATFFIGGSWADDNVQCLKDIFAAGHEIGNHGYFHKAQDKMNLADNKKEISSCNRFIQLAIGKSPTLFAPPSGAYGEATLSAARALGMKTVLWSKDTIDWRDKDSELIYKRATKNVQKGDFILMHPMQATVDALADILHYYTERGLKTVTVSENLQLEG